MAGFLNLALLTSGLNKSLLWGVVLCSVKCIAASHNAPLDSSSIYPVVTTDMSLDITKFLVRIISYNWIWIHLTIIQQGCPPACLLSRFSHVWLFRPHGLYPARFICPWDSPGRILDWVAMPFSPTRLLTPNSNNLEMHVTN